MGLREEERAGALVPEQGRKTLRGTQSVCVSHGRGLKSGSSIIYNELRG